MEKKEKWGTKIIEIVVSWIAAKILDHIWEHLKKIGLWIVGFFCTDFGIHIVEKKTSIEISWNLTLMIILIINIIIYLLVHLAKRTKSWARVVQKVCYFLIVVLSAVFWHAELENVILDKTEPSSIEETQSEEASTEEISSNLKNVRIFFTRKLATVKTSTFEKTLYAGMENHRNIGDEKIITIKDDKDNEYSITLNQNELFEEKEILLEPGIYKVSCEVELYESYEGQMEVIEAENNIFEIQLEPNRSNVEEVLIDNEKIKELLLQSKKIKDVDKIVSLKVSVYGREEFINLDFKENFLLEMDRGKVQHILLRRKDQEVFFYMENKDVFVPVDEFEKEKNEYLIIELL